MKPKLPGFFFQSGNQALVEADGGVALAADDVVVMVISLFREVESFSAKRDSLKKAGFIKRFEDPVDGGAIAGGGTHLGVNLVWRERSVGFFDKAKDSPTTRSGLQTCLAKGIVCSPCVARMGHKEVRCG